MIDLTERLVEYLISDHQRLASIATADGAGAVAQLEAQLQKAKATARHQHENDSETINALTTHLTEARRLCYEQERHIRALAEQVQQLEAEPVAVPGVAENVARWVRTAYTMWDEDPDQALQAIERAHLALTRGGHARADSDATQMQSNAPEMQSK